MQTGRARYFLPPLDKSKTVIRIFNRSVPLRSLGLRVCEALLVFAALFVAFRAGMEQHLALTATTYGQVALVGCVTLLCMSCLDSYEPHVTTHRAHSLSRIIQAMGLTMIVTAVLPHAWPGIHIDVSSILIGMVMLGISLTVTRYLFAELARRPDLAEPAVVWGSGPLARNIIQELRRRPDIGIRVVGIVEEPYPRNTFAGRYLGSPENIWSMAAWEWPGSSSLP